MKQKFQYCSYRGFSVATSFEIDWRFLVSRFKTGSGNRIIFNPECIMVMLSEFTFMHQGTALSRLRHVSEGWSCDDGAYILKCNNPDEYLLRWIVHELQEKDRPVEIPLDRKTEFLCDVNPGSGYSRTYHWRCVLEPSIFASYDDETRIIPCLNPQWHS